MKPIHLGLGFVALASILPAKDENPDHSFKILSQNEIITRGAAITYALVTEPTSLPKRTVESAAVSRPESAAEQAKVARWEAKEHITLSVSATVYLTEPIITEVKLRVGDEEYICYSNIDFRDLAQTTYFEDENTVYSWFPWVYEQKPSPEAPVPSHPLVAAASGYILASPADRPRDAAAFRGLDIIHAYHSANKDRLRQERLARDAANAAREKELKDNPPAPQPAKVFIWKKQPAE